MTTVYRVEDPAQLGPYTEGYGSTITRMRDNHNFGPAHLHPSPYTSWAVRMRTQPGNARCAFMDMQSLFRWFGGWLPGLLREGFHIAAIDEAHVTHGPDDVGQVIFLDSRKDRNAT